MRVKCKVMCIFNREMLRCMKVRVVMINGVERGNGYINRKSHFEEWVYGYSSGWLVELA